jgi:hypothetical protein
MARAGKRLENLVDVIERVTAASPNVKVESPKRLRDKNTGKLREHDVVLTFLQGHHEVLTALECRDRSRPVGVPAIEGFKTKCEVTGVHRGIIVSATGFTGTAIETAQRYNIGCLSLDEVEAFDWCLSPGIFSVQAKLVSARAVVIPEEPMGGNFSLFLNDGTKVEKEIIRKWARNAYLSLKASAPPAKPTCFNWLSAISRG